MEKSDQFIVVKKSWKHGGVKGLACCRFRSGNMLCTRRQNKHGNANRGNKEAVREALL